MTRTANAVMAERKMLMLVHLDSLAEPGMPLCLSYGWLGRSMGLSDGQVRRICKLLQEEGALRVESRFLDNGARLENAYELTPAGKRQVGDWCQKGGSLSLT